MHPLYASIFAGCSALVPHGFAAFFMYISEGFAIVFFLSFFFFVLRYISACITVPSMPCSHPLGIHVSHPQLAREGKGHPGGQT